VSAKHAVLGLVIDQPSYAYRIASGVRRQLRFADLADSYPYWALEKLETEGLVRRVDEEGKPLRNAAQGRRAIYEATALGVASFEDWLLSTTSEPPLRDDLHFRIALCRPRDAPRMIELIQGQELVCLGRVQDLKRASEADAVEGSEWDRIVRVISRDAELAFWHARIEWLQGVREMLESLPSKQASTGSDADSSRPQAKIDLDPDSARRHSRVGSARRQAASGAGLGSADGRPSIDPYTAPTPRQAAIQR
jgi:DNA-binding PadR family transcriptional regulator